MAINCPQDLCVFITQDELCRYSPLNIDLQKLQPQIELANEEIGGILRECDLCDGFGDEGYEFSKITDLASFKHLYARLIYKFWLMDSGSGQARETGVVRTGQDELSEYTVVDSRDVQLKINGNDSIVLMLRNKLVEFVKKDADLRKACFECPDDELDCGCVNYCTCEPEDTLQQFAPIKNTKKWQGNHGSY